MPFVEICIYQVKPEKVEDFEAIMLEAKSFLEKQEGALLLRLVKRGVSHRHGAAQKNLYNSYWKSIEKCLIVPHEKYLGEGMF